MDYKTIEQSHTAFAKLEQMLRDPEARKFLRSETGADGGSFCAATVLPSERFGYKKLVVVADYAKGGKYYSGKAIVDVVKIVGGGFDAEVLFSVLCEAAADAKEVDPNDVTKPDVDDLILAERAA
jgi:hypothetical protein